uniref:Uncharacterized protein n=1 Tax=Timema shepardi TaxID=629360 RepID=A0A7R9ATH5_TIMSH|nr:unnamed protein product [Timema shepardi]
MFRRLKRISLDDVVRPTIQTSWRAGTSVDDKRGAAGVIPEASQEGLLHPFKSYADITLFHYNVPPEVYRATWEFAAFMDNPKCAVKEVYIFVRIGQRSNISTPVAFSPLPPTLSIASHVLFYSPYPLKSSHSSALVYPTPQELIQPSIGERIFIPTGTWQFSVTVSNCTFHVKSFLRFNKADTYCIEGLALEARALPPYDLKSGVGNLTTKTQHTFIENEPFTDGYYYLLVISKSQVNFTIHVITTDLRSSLADKLLFYLSFTGEPELLSLPPHFIIQALTTLLCRPAPLNGSSNIIYSKTGRAHRMSGTKSKSQALGLDHCAACPEPRQKLGSPVSSQEEAS